MKKIDLYLQNLVNKHSEERQRKLRREKEQVSLITEIKMDEEIGQRRPRPESSQYDLADFGIAFEEDFAETKEGYEMDFADRVAGPTESQSQSQSNSLLKTVPFQGDPDELGFDSAETLFDDMFGLKEHYCRKIESTFDSEWQVELNQSLRMLRTKYREIYDPDHLNKLIEKFVRDHFEIRF